MHGKWQPRRVAVLRVHLFNMLTMQSFTTNNFMGAQKLRDHFPPQESNQQINFRELTGINAQKITCRALKL
jgi:hypothetical protein